MSEWISVKDRLPDEEGYYLCYAPGYYSFRTMEWAAAAIGDKREWWVDATSPTSTVTHWMPLPLPPETEE